MLLHCYLGRRKEYKAIHDFQNFCLPLWRGDIRCFRRDHMGFAFGKVECPKQQDLGLHRLAPIGPGGKAPLQQGKDSVKGDAEGSDHHQASEH